MALLVGILVALPFFLAVRYLIVKREAAHKVPGSIRKYGSASDSVGFMSAILLNILSGVGQVIYEALGGESFVSSIEGLSLSPTLGVVVLLSLGTVFAYGIWWSLNHHKKSVELMMEDL